MSKYDHLKKEQLIALLQKRDRTRKLDEQIPVKLCDVVFVKWNVLPRAKQ